MADGPPRSISADRIYHDGRFRRGLVIELEESGRIAGLRPGDRGELHLRDRALLPGFVNAHSHAFQHALRGRTGPGAEPDSHFWSWRESMYGLAASLTPAEVYEISLRAYREMAAAGYTTVGEFHYLHHGPDGRRYEDPSALARQVVTAAREAGLRVVLLNVFYERGGLDDEPLAGAQRRFGGEDVEEFLARTRRLTADYAGDELVSVGVAAHSVRAVRPESMQRIFRAAREEHWPFHIHLSEQRKEVEDCEAAHGVRPVELASELGVLGPLTTGVHCTHITDDEIARLADSGAAVCACPTTEADLGDGFLRALELRQAGVPVSLGSDSQARIDPFEEMRAVEYHERLRHERRNVLGVVDGGGGATSGLARQLIRMAAGWGGRSLGLDVGELADGMWADLVEIDLRHAILYGWEAGSLEERVALGGDPRIVAGAHVAGRRIR